MAQLIISYKNRRESHVGGISDEFVRQIECELHKYYHGYISKINADGGFVTVVFNRKTNTVERFTLQSVSNKLRTELEVALSKRPMPPFIALD